MTQLASSELHAVFDARRVKAPELRGLDSMVNGFVGWVKNRQPVLAQLRAQAERIEALEPEIHALSSSKFREEVQGCRELARLKKLEDAALERGMAIAREGAFRATGKRPYLVQMMGALAMCRGAVAEMATGEGKTLTASVAASRSGERRVGKAGRERGAG